VVSNNSQRLLSFYETSSAFAFGRMSSNLIGVAHNSPFLSFFFRDAFEALYIFAIFWPGSDDLDEGGARPPRESNRGNSRCFLQATFFPLQTTTRESNARNYSRKWAKMKP
jgi:hypothetical protein